MSEPAGSRQEAPTVGVLALQGDVREHRAVLEGLGARPVLVRQTRDLAEVQGLVIPGGESTTIGRLLRREGLLSELQERGAEGLPMFGTCAGMILLARTIEASDQSRLGLMDLSVRRNAYGRQVASFEVEIPEHELGGSPLRGVFIRAPLITGLGDDVRVLARHEGRPVLVRQDHLLAASFHPELTGDDRIHRYFVDRLVRRRETASPHPQ